MQILDTVRRQLADFEKDYENLSNDIEKLNVYSEGKHLPDRDDKKIFEILNELLLKYPANPLLIQRLTWELQLCDDEEICNTYEFTDIKELLVHAADIYEYDMQLSEELFFSMYAYDDDEEAAFAYLKSFREKTDKLFNDIKTHVEQ